MPVKNSLADAREEMTAWRHSLHENPQTSYEEEFASALVKKKLAEWGIPFKDNIAVTGVVATIEGQTTASGRRIGLRADMDALDITEKTGLPHASKNPGKMHACGHDGHTATLLGAAKYLNETKNFDGTVHLIFQPAEEGDAGAHRMIDEGLFRDFPCEAVFGLHNWPEMPLGQIGMRTGPIMASADEFKITIRGKGGHAAMPHDTVDPVLVASHLVLALQSIVSRNVDPVDQAVVTVSNFNAGTGAHNVIPDEATLVGTVRAFRQETREFVHHRIREKAAAIAGSFMAEADVHFEDGYDPTINSAAETELAAKVAAEIVGAENVDTDTDPTMGAEDFGAYLMQKPGTFVFVGQATDDPDSPHNQGVHTPYYDFNDDILPIGASYFATLVEKYLPLKSG